MAEQMLNTFKCPHGFVDDDEDCIYQSREECAACKCGQYIAAEKIYYGMLIDKYGLGCLWISVKDRLPEEKDYHECEESYDGVVLWWNGKTIGIGWYYESTGSWANLHDSEIYGVTHWMPIPEPPKEGQ